MVDPNTKITFCTIVTANYIHYALSLYQSLERFQPNVNFTILIADEKVEFEQVVNDFPIIKILWTQDFCVKGMAKTIYDKYYQTNRDCFRWSMKSVLLKYLLEQGYEQAFFLDPDLFFFNPFEFLYQELAGQSVLLTPHWRASNPLQDQRNFELLQTNGLFNAGFIGVSQAGIPAMKWWSNVCVYECIKDPERGLFVDQAYLDLMPIYFENIKILRHQGCNVANWNQIECKRIKVNNQILINHQWKIIFIHFTKSTIRGIQVGDDKLLYNNLQEYESCLKSNHKYIPLTISQMNKHHKSEKIVSFTKILEVIKLISQKIKQNLFS